MIHKYLYDNEEQFYPISEATAIISGVVVQGNTVWQDLEQIWAKAQSAYNYATGGQTVSGSLQVDVYYKNSTESNETNIISEGDTGWEATMTPPNSSAPYCWKRTRYYWKINESETPQVIKTIYEICATALYPETQTMYAVTTQVNSTDIGGPSNYSTDISGVVDKMEESVRWYSNFPGISSTATMGYMATRHRDAGQNWPEDGGWHVALFAVYPTT